nr:hypothetical protein CFP56_69593 [Quercus suber]
MNIPKGLWQIRKRMQEQSMAIPETSWAQPRLRIEKWSSSRSHRHDVEEEEWTVAEEVEERPSNEDGEKDDHGDQVPKEAEIKVALDASGGFAECVRACEGGERLDELAPWTARGEDGAHGNGVGGVLSKILYQSPNQYAPVKIPVCSNLYRPLTIDHSFQNSSNTRTAEDSTSHFCPN